MAQKDTVRVQHDVDVLPNLFRKADLEQIINDISEDISGKGFLELIKTGVFVDQVILWKDSNKNLKRKTIDITRTGAFVSQVVETIYAESDDSVVISTNTVTINRAGDNSVISVNSVNSRN